MKKIEISIWLIAAIIVIGIGMLMMVELIEQMPMLVAFGLLPLVIALLKSEDQI